MSGVTELEKLRHELDKRKAEGSLIEFIRQGWRWIEPAEFVPGWHIEAICDHLEAILNGEIKRLLINLPPRHMKSIALNVFMPAYAWAQNPDPDKSGHGLAVMPGKWRGPGVRFMHLAYKEPLATRDGDKCRRLIRSPWYQGNWAKRFQIIRDQETRADNDHGGHRLSYSTSGVMGEGGDVIAFDDPHDYIKVESTAEREKLLQFFDEGLTTRFNDRERGALVVCMQRLDNRDLSGHIIAKELKAIELHGQQRTWHHVCLPARFESEHPFPFRSSVIRKSTGEPWKDPREDGERLWPARFSEQGMRDLEIELNSQYAIAGQLQQRPAPRGGGMFKRAWFSGKIIGSPDCPIHAISKGTRFVRHWDLAATSSKAAAFTAGVKLGKTPDGNFIVAHVTRVQKEGPEVRDLIKSIAASDGQMVEISLPKDPGQAGKVQAADMVRMLAGYRVHAEAETGSKETRAEPVASQAAQGNLYLMAGTWNDAFLEELESFPNGQWKDQVDALSGAFGRLNERGRISTGFVTGLH